MGISDKQRFLASLDEKQKVLFAHIYDLAQRSSASDIPVYGDFLSESEQSELIVRKNILPCEFTLFGGYEDADRKMAAFIPEWAEADYPISALRIEGKNLSGITHRDYLGSIMGLGIKREKCGDIIISDSGCFAVMEKDIAVFAANSLLYVSREHVTTQVCPIDKITVPERQYKEIHGTVATLRLDAVVSLFTSKGRAAACELILSGRVFVNGICSLKTDMRLSDGEVISVRGTGKAILEIGGTSRKERIFVTLKKYA